MDDRVFRISDRTFDETWPTYSYAPLTRLLLRTTERWRKKRVQRVLERVEAEPELNVSRQLTP